MAAEGKVGGPGRLRRPVLVAIAGAALIAAGLAAALALRPRGGAEGPECISVWLDRAPENGVGYAPTISADGRYVAFLSEADNLVPGDTNWVPDVFVFNRRTRVTRRVNLAFDGSELHYGSRNFGLSPDGRFVAFETREMPLAPDGRRRASGLFLRDLVTGAVEYITPTMDGAAPNGYVWAGALSADATIVTFASKASNLVEGDGNGAGDVFVFDRARGRVELVSVSRDGGAANGESFRASVSADGRYVAFGSNASNLIAGGTPGPSQVYVRDRLAGTTILASCDATGPLPGGCGIPWISADGRTVALTYYPPGGPSRVLVNDLRTGVLERVPSDGTLADSDPGISGNGRYVAFWRTGWNRNDYCDLYRYDRDIGSLECLCPAAGVRRYPERPSLSFDGRCVAFFVRSRRHRSPRQILGFGRQPPALEKQVYVLGPRPQPDAPAH